MTENIQTLAHWLRHSKSAVAFTGAGISTESGIPDFRSPGGVWATNSPVYFDDFLRSEESRIEYWRQKSLTHDEFFQAQPNIAHLALAAWERKGVLHGLITQNIDGLHQVGGSVNVLELHGTAREIGCLQCYTRFEAGPLVAEFKDTGRPPVCQKCGGLLKHATISFGQSLSPDVLQTAAAWAKRSDVFLAIGSSLVVTPAADLPALAKRHGAKLAIINRETTPLDHLADIVINDSIGEVFSELAAAEPQP